MQIVGTSRPVHDAAAKVAGAAVYAGDMVLPGMLHAALLFSPIPRGIVKKVDTEAALALPGVVDVLHAFNTTDRLFNRYRNIAGQPVPNQEQVFPRQVRFVGDRVACVLAETPAAARAGVRALAVEYEPLPAAATLPEARTGVIDDMHPEGAVYPDYVFEAGQPPAGGAGVETESTTELARVNHVTLEPHACVASYSRPTGEVTVWSPNQSVFGLRTVMADLFELPYEKLRVVKTTMGGSFGAKQEWMLEPVAIAAALRCGRPVRLVYTRREAMVSTISRCPAQGRVRSLATEEGRLLAMDIDVTLDAGAYLGNSDDYLKAMSGKPLRCYRIGHLKFIGRAVCTNAPVSGAFRGWGAPELFAMVEHNLNQTARRLGMDPVELRLRNVVGPEDVDPKTGQPLGRVRIRECLEQGRASFAWAEKQREDELFNAAGGRYRRGVGVACGGHVNGYFPRMQDFGGIEMRLTESGGVLVNASLHDHGCGSVTAVQMIVAEALGLPEERVQAREGDTAATPMDMGCFASRTIYVVGRAALDCAEKLKRRLLEDMAELWGRAAATLECRAGEVLCPGETALRCTYGEAVVRILRELQREVWVKHQYVNGSNPGVGGAHFAQVQVDTLTGMVDVLDYLAVHDIGQAINREMCVAQIQGAVQMGCGAALRERQPLRQNGAVGSLKDYHLYTATEAPPVRVELIEDGGNAGPYGAKSIGEVCHVPVAPAVAAAVNDALGSSLCSLPLDPDAILAWLGQNSTGEGVQCG